MPYSNRLKAIIIDSIRTFGPLNVAEYMDICLNHERYGYYKTQNIFGSAGDFITAPELSQIFGELLAIWLLTVWQQNNCPNNVILCEAGPGRGTLMQDMLRSFNQLAPKFLYQLEIKLIETSPQLIQKQQAALKAFSAAGVQISWHNDLHNLPAKPLFFIGNEFLDALPIKQYIYHKTAFYERKITLNSKNELVFTRNAQSANLPFASAPLKDYYYNLPEGSIVELSPLREKVIKTLGRHIKSYGGIAMLIDYGELTPAHGDTLQAVKQHKYINIFQNPGEADLTSQVDFYTLAAIAKAVHCHSYGMSQGQLLTALGAIERANTLILQQNSAKATAILSAVDRLINPDKMGKLFKTLVISAEQQTPPIFTNKERL